MARKTWIKVKRGILEPRHINKLGVAWYLYFYILDNADWETGKIFEWKDKFAADELGKPLGMIREHRKLLVTEKYITTTQNRLSQTITIMNWTNPRMYDGKVLNEGSEKDEPYTEKADEGSGKGYGKGVLDHAKISHSSLYHITHNTGKDKDILDEAFNTMRISLFSNTLSPSWWKIMEDAPKVLDGDVLKIFVDNPKMVSDINNMPKSYQKGIAICNYPFKSFILEEVK